MSGYLLDTKVPSEVIRNPNGPAARRIRQARPRTLFTSVIVAAELRYGCAKKGAPRLLAKVEALLELIPVLPLDVPADVEHGALRALLEAAGEPIGMNDLLIAAHAKACGLILVTGNTREFGRIPGLKVENWVGTGSGP